MFFKSKKKEENNNAPVLAADNKPVADKEDKAPVRSAIGKMIMSKSEGLLYEVIISKDTAINGNINIEGNTRIDGVIDGTLTVESDLFVGETGMIRASVYAKNAVISGTIIGDVVCPGRLEFTSTAKITGNIKCSVLVIAEGAVFHGNSSPLDVPAEAASFEQEA